MKLVERVRVSWLPALVGLLAGMLLSVHVPLTAQAPGGAEQTLAPHAPSTFVAEVPPARGWDATLYMQTAAEYRACCYQAYNVATRRLRELASQANANGKPPAVVMDLDETVLDNAGFQAMLLRSGLAYDQRLWNLWEEQFADFVALLPGVKEFIDEARRLGVAVVHISNRSETYRPATERALKRLGIPITKPDQLWLSTTTSDKTQRRREVEKLYRVLLYVGDNLRDFDETFRCTVDNTKPATRTTDPARLEAAIRERKEKVDQNRAKWGAEWIILPNPAYGEWTKPLGLGAKDLDRLVPTATKKP